MNLLHSKVSRLPLPHIFFRLDMLRCLLIVHVITPKIAFMHSSRFECVLGAHENPAKTFRLSLALTFQPHSAFHVTPSLFNSKKHGFLSF